MPDRSGYGTPCPHESSGTPLGTPLPGATHLTHVTGRQWAAARSQARRAGREAGHAAGTWVFDGNTPRETYEAFRKGIDAGDPVTLDSLRTPNLSGEFAGDPTPHSVLTDCGLDLYVAEYVFDDVITTWETAADEAFWNEVGRAISAQLD